MIVVAIIGLLAAIAIPNFVKARTSAQKNACIANMRQIEGAKEQWALENKKTEGAATTGVRSRYQCFYPRRQHADLPRRRDLHLWSCRRVRDVQLGRGGRTYAVVESAPKWTALPHWH